jgi:YidC/Oxa1 family membrane protein insertase
MNFFVQITLPALDFFFEITKNYGLAIILLTAAIKLAFWNMTNKQYQSMDAMKKIQPKVKELQAKHKKDPEKMQRELLVLYKEHGVNPLGGCLPMLVQLPVLIALFQTLSSQEFLTKTVGKSFLWIRNISFAETANFTAILSQPKNILFEKVSALGLTGMNSPLVIGATVIPVLALLVALTTYYSQKTMSVDPQQQKMMAFMPIFLFFISMNLNAGVLLYWIVSNLLTAIQQSYVQKHKAVKEKVVIGEIDHIKNK